MLQCTITTRCAAAMAALLLLAAPAAAQGNSSPEPGHALEGAALVRALRGGGYTLYFRHTATDFSQHDRAMTGYAECATQRNLSDAGRAQARAIGEAIRALGLPVGEVIASPFCRTMETGRLMFGRAEPRRSCAATRARRPRTRTTPGSSRCSPRRRRRERFA